MHSNLNERFDCTLFFCCAALRFRDGGGVVGIGVPILMLLKLLMTVPDGNRAVPLYPMLTSSTVMSETHYKACNFSLISSVAITGSFKREKYFCGKSPN